MALESAIRELNSITRSHHRVQILTWLLDEGSLSDRELRDRVDASRTTVNRNLEALEEQGWIHRGNREVRLSPPAELVAAKLLEIVGLVQIADRLRPIAEWVPSSVMDIDAGVLTEATVVTPNSTDPYAPVSRHIELLESVEEFRCILPAVGLQAMRTAHARVVDGCSSQEVIVDEDVIATLTTTPAYRSLLGDMLATDRLDVFVSEDDCEFYLGVTDSRVQIGVEDDDGVPRGLLEFDSTAGRRWAERTYSRYKANARPFARPGRDEVLLT